MVCLTRVKCRKPTFNPLLDLCFGFAGRAPKPSSLPIKNQTDKVKCKPEPGQKRNNMKSKQVRNVG